MAKNNNLQDFVKDLADTIRTKKGYSSSTKINPQNFSSEISSIPSGGSKYLEIYDHGYSELTTIESGTVYNFGSNWPDVLTDALAYDDPIILENGSNTWSLNLKLPTPTVVTSSSPGSGTIISTVTPGTTDKYLSLTIDDGGYGGYMKGSQYIKINAAGPAMNEFKTSTYYFSYAKEITSASATYYSWNPTSVSIGGSTRYCWGYWSIPAGGTIYYGNGKVLEDGKSLFVGEFNYYGASSSTGNASGSAGYPIYLIKNGGLLYLGINSSTSQHFGSTTANACGIVFSVPVFVGFDYASATAAWSFIKTATKVSGTSTGSKYKWAYPYYTTNTTGGNTSPTYSAPDNVQTLIKLEGCTLYANSSSFYATMLQTKLTKQ